LISNFPKRKKPTQKQQSNTHTQAKARARHNGKNPDSHALDIDLAEYLADTIAWLMRSILDHASKILFDNETEPLLTPGFWILPLYSSTVHVATD